ncbi:DUF4194 domain-containing protein [Nocardioides convexus]|uniref:DUF4194 domain-containing protein n=1 Tax=Nocardioides convexus TaxID=2712224 RepID=UPI002418ACBC|nr:DUF4194 domain-containing protein [Nocardioides convexus]
MDDETSVSLFEGDEGGLEFAQRHALVTLLKQRFISARTHPRDWQVLVEHERVLRSRLNDLFLDLAIDPTREVAWKRQAVSETASRFPTLLHDTAWTREETLVLVHLRDRLRAGLAGGDARVFVDRDDVLEYVAGYRPPHATDEAGDEKRARNAVTSIVKAGLLIPTGSEDRFEVSEAVEPLLPLEAAAGACWRRCRRPTGPSPRSRPRTPTCSRRTASEHRRGRAGRRVRAVREAGRRHPRRRHRAVARLAAPGSSTGAGSAVSPRSRWAATRR